MAEKSKVVKKQVAKRLSKAKIKRYEEQIIINLQETRELFLGEELKKYDNLRVIYD